jgi:hypothetical protein
MWKSRLVDHGVDLFHAGLRLLDALFRAKPSQQSEPPGTPLVQGRVVGVQQRLAGDGHCDLECPIDVQTAEPGRSDADDLKGMPVQAQGLAYNGRVAGEPALPETVADHGERRRSPPVIVGVEDAPPESWNAQDPEEISTRPHAERHVAFAPISKVEPVLRVGGNTRKRLLAVANLLPNRIGENPVLPLLDLDQPAWIFDRQGPQHHRVYDAEDGRVRPDAQRQ